MQIDGKSIGRGHPPYIICEMSANHNGDLDRALKLIEAAKEAGADGVKTQLYDPRALAELRGGFDKVLNDGIWMGRTLGDLYLEAHTPSFWFPRLFAHAADVGITLFSSIFDEDGINMLEGLGCPAYKVASREAADLRLVAEAAATGKPLIISTGTATEEELGRSVAEAVKWTNQVALLYCVSQYPARSEDIHLDTIEDLWHRYGLPVGFSDHTIGIDAAVEAVKHGACIIEKHMTLSRDDGGPDAAFSLEPHEFKDMVQAIRLRNPE